MFFCDTLLLCALLWRSRDSNCSAFFVCLSVFVLEWGDLF